MGRGIGVVLEGRNKGLFWPTESSSSASCLIPIMYKVRWTSVSSSMSAPYLLLYCFYPAFISHRIGFAVDSHAIR
jgi:hypothetical protein